MKVSIERENQPSARIRRDLKHIKQWERDE
jgi:hypothetical protein